MELQERQVGAAMVVAVTGDITMNAGGDVRLRDKVQSLLQQGHRHILLDLAGVAYIDSAGLGQLVRLHATTINHGGSLKLLHLTKRLNDLLVLTRLSTVFESFENEADALASIR